MPPRQAADYWAAVPTTIDGMLGGFAKISHTDIDGSNKLLKLLMKVGRWPVGNWDRTHSVKHLVLMSRRLKMCDAAVAVVGDGCEQVEGGPGAGRALDCGAGIGRITKHLLTKVLLNTIANNGHSFQHCNIK